jgi:ABC-type transporter Mla subunit MlaD
MIGLAAVAGCGSSGSTAAPPSPTVGPATQWAGSVCSSVQTLQQSLTSLTSKITIDVNPSQPSLDQAKQQMRQRVNAVEAAAAGVVTSVGNLPPSSDQDLRNAQQQLKASSDRSQQALQQVKSAATQLQSAGVPAQFAKDIVAVGAAALGAASDVGDMLSSLKRYVSSTHISVKNAFGDAPSCRALQNST